MKIHKEVRILIENRMLDKPDITIDEVVYLLKSYAERPDLKLLEEREFRGTARRLLASFRDAEGTREVFCSGRQAAHLCGGGALRGLGVAEPSAQAIDQEAEGHQEGREEGCQAAHHGGRANQHGRATSWGRHIGEVGAAPLGVDGMGTGLRDEGYNILQI